MSGWGEFHVIPGPIKQRDVSLITSSGSLYLLKKPPDPEHFSFPCPIPSVSDPFCCCLIPSHVQTLCDPMYCGLPAPPVHRISQAGTLEGAAISSNPWHLQTHLCSVLWSPTSLGRCPGKEEGWYWLGKQYLPLSLPSCFLHSWSGPPIGPCGWGSSLGAPRSAY